MNMSRIELYNIVDRMIELMGVDELLMDLIKAQSSNELQANLEYIDNANDLGLIDN